MATDFGARLRSARRHKLLTQKQLAHAVGISQGTLSELESIGHGSAYAPQIAEICGVSATWLASGEGEMLEASSRAHKVAALPRGTSGADLRSQLEALASTLATVPDDRRTAVAGLLHGFAKEGGAATYIDAILALLTPPSNSGTSKQRAA